MERELPDCWDYTSLEELSVFVIGGDWGDDPEKTSDNETKDVLCIRGSELKQWTKNKGNTAAKRKVKKSSLEKRKLTLGDILVEISGGGPDQPVGRTVIIDQEVLEFEPEIPKVCTNFFRLVRLHHGIEKAYINYFLQYFYYTGEIVNYQGGTNNLRNLRFPEYSRIEIPLAPLPEQTRIVAKLDALFAHIDTLKSKLDRIPELLKNFRQQVLTQAVTGKLTEEWRKGKELKEWKVVSSSNIFEFVTSGSRGWAQYYKETGKQLFVRITNMNYGNYNIDLSPSKLQFLDLPENSEGKRTLLQARDILISITADIGMISLVPKGFPFEAYVNQHVCLARPIKAINEKYLALFLMSDKGFGQLEERKRGMTKAGLTLGDIKNLTISIPSIKEQHEIVRRNEELFQMADIIEARYKNLKEKIDTLPQAILTKAFKGELVPQDPNDEPASVLLERIRKEKR